MLDLKFVQNNLDVVRESLEKRGSKLDVNEFNDLDSRRKSLLQEVESLKAERNSTSGEIAKIKREGGDASEIIARMGEVSGKIKALDEDLKDIEFPIFIQMCVSEINNSYDRYTNLGYKDHLDFYLGKSAYNETLYGWSGHSKYGSTLGTVEG